MAGKSFLVCGDARNHAEFLDAQMREPEAIRSSLFRLMERRVVDPTGEPTSLAQMRESGSGRTMRGHREHLMAPARQLTSSASLKGKRMSQGNRLLK